MKAKLVKFDDDGTQCKRDIEYLRRHPECGIPFIQDKPFKPDNPKHKFRPHDRNFSIDILDRAIPSDPNIPPAPPIGQTPKIGEAVGAPPYTSEYLPQDYTNRYDLAGRRILADTPHGHSVDEYISTKIVNAFNKSGYGIVPRIGNDSYSHETPERFTRPVGDIELEDFGAGVGIPNEAPPPIRQTRIRPLADPRNTEFGRTEKINITDLPEEIKDYIISRKGSVPNQVDVNVLKSDLAELEDLVEGFEEDRQMVRDEMIRNVNEGYELLAEENIRFLGRHAGNKNDLRDLKNKIKETQRKITQRRVLSPTRRPVADPRDTEFPLPQEVNITDLPPDIKEYILTKTTGIVDEGKTTIDINEMRNEARRLIDSEEGTAQTRFRNRMLGEKLQKTADNLEKRISSKTGLRKILGGKPNVLKPRGMTDEELIDAQIEQLTRNSTQEEVKQIEQSIRSKGKGKGRAKVKPTEQEMFPIEPIDEYVVVTDEVEKILKSGEDTLTIKQKEKLVREMESRGISRQRTEEILEEANVYDPALERAVGSSSRPQVERLARLLQRGIRSIPTRDTNLLPERLEEIELREDTPLTRGRTDITRGRGRVEKVYDRTAGKLPEELRTLAGSVKRNAEAFNENVRTRSLEAIQRVRATSTRVFGQKYTGIREIALELRGGDIELVAPEGNINIRPPATEDITGLRQGDLQALDFNPLGADYQESFVGGARPKLTYAERLQRVRTGALSGDTAVAGGGAVGGVLIGFGVAELMGQAGVDNKYAIAATAGGAGGAGARILTMAGSRALTRGAGSAVAETATYTAIRGGTSLLRGAAEGAVIGLALMPVDMLLNNVFVNSGMSHTGANLASGALVGGTATAVTTIGLASLGAAPETLGASLVVGGLAMAATSIIGFFTGQDQDEQERKAKEAERARNELISTAQARQRLLATLPNYDYNFDRALNAFTDKNNLGIDNDTWSTFSNNSRSMFVPRPSNNPPTPTSGEQPTGEQKKINDLFSQYITHELIGRVCTGDTGCEELRRHDQGVLTEDEVKFLNDKTGSTWQGQANMQVEMSVQELNYTRQRIGDAQLEMLNAWNNEQKVANQLDPYIVQTASLDPNFRQQYDLAVKLDAEQRVVDVYQNNQTRIEQLPKNIRDMANTDPEFDNIIHQYYNSMETTSGQLDISVPQLIELQGLEGEAQKDKYQEFQFDNIKENPTIVSEAQEIASEEDQVREAGFYDIDQAFLETDPTAINTWHPTDSQILQAHSAGMNLNEYVDYMHQLAKGSLGDYSKLPKYTDEQLRASGLLDYSHFQDELQMAGYRKDLYLYDEETRQFTLNPNVTNSSIPSTQQTFISRYTPRYLLQARQEYAHMIHGLNEKNQSEVDNYNANLMKELSSYGKHYDSIVSDINNERLYEGRSDLLFYDVGKMYNANRIEFSALSDKLSDAPKVNIISQDEAMGRQLAQKVSIKEKYTLSDTQYRNVKLNIESKNIKSPTEEQINQAVSEVKSFADDTPPMAS